MITTEHYGKDYLSVLGYACVKPEFRNDLLANGAAAVEMHHLPVVLTPQNRTHLDEFRDDEKKAAFAESWNSAGGEINAACKQPPCPYYGVETE